MFIFTAVLRRGRRDITDQIYLKPRAKINVSLAVGWKRPDGYHELTTVMQTLILHDALFMKKIHAETVKLSVNLAFLPTNEKNLAYRAVNYMRERFETGGGVYMELIKNIPVSAGLGGGSADCAAALIGMRELYGLPVSDGEMLKIAETFGADVPFCMTQGTALARGKGEILEKLPPHPFAHVLLARPPVIVSTADVFNNYTENISEKRPDAEKVAAGIRAGDLELIAEGIGNDLEAVTAKKYPQISRIKGMMLEYGAVCSSMTGSGPCVFGYFINKKDARAAASEIREKERVKEIFLTGIFNETEGNNLIRSD